MYVNTSKKRIFNNPEKVGGVSQVSDLSPLFYNNVTTDIPLSNKTLLATSSYDTAIFASNNDPYIVSQNLHIHLNTI
jgi:hypothetical protein